MPTATVTSKGQITIPIEVREVLGLHAGDRVDFVRLEDGTFILRPASLSASRLAGFFGTWEGRAISLEEIDAAIARGAATA